MDDLGLLILLALVFYAGWKVHEYFTILAIKESPEIFEDACRAARAELNGEIIDDDDLVEMEVETHDGIVYAYDKTTGDFLGQGSSVYQAAASAASRFKGVKFYHPQIEDDIKTLDQGK